MIWQIDSALCIYTHLDWKIHQCAGELTCNNWIILINIEEPGWGKSALRWCSGVCVGVMWLVFYYPFFFLSVLWPILLQKAELAHRILQPISLSFSDYVTLLHLLVALWPLHSLSSQNCSTGQSSFMMDSQQGKRSYLNEWGCERASNTEVTEKEFIPSHPLCLQSESSCLVLGYSDLLSVALCSNARLDLRNMWIKY